MSGHICGPEYPVLQISFVYPEIAYHALASQVFVMLTIVL